MHTFAFTGLLASTLFSFTSAAVLGPRQTARTASVAAYFGQAPNQDRLKTFCDDNSIDIFPIGFVNGFPSDPGNNGYPETNFGNQCGGYYGNTKTFLACSYLIEDIAYCQARGKKILISIGGGVSSGRLLSDADGTNFANQLWQIFGPKPCGYTGPRPFGDNVVDGFDLDIEQNGNTGVAALAAGLRANMDSDTTKAYLLTAAPQCPIVDAQLGDALTKVRFDYVWVQFYNTAFCSARAHFDQSYGPDINFNAWVTWLKANSPSTPPKLFIGLPASTAAANPGYYLTLDEVTSLLTSLDSADLFGGIMLYDAMYSRVNSISSQTYASNVHALLDERGFARAATTANNGYIYNCATSTSSTVTSTATTLTSSTSMSSSLTTSSSTTSFVPTSTSTILTTPQTTSTAFSNTFSTTSGPSSSISTSSAISSTPTSTSSGCTATVTITVSASSATISSTISPSFSATTTFSSSAVTSTFASTISASLISSTSDTPSVPTYTGSGSHSIESLSPAMMALVVCLGVAIAGLVP